MEAPERSPKERMRRVRLILAAVARDPALDEFLRETTKDAVDRLEARIKRHEEPLPVLLDDSLTNFDREHIDRTLNVVSELADETQVFVFTCHPSLLDQIESDHDAAYWCLDDGQFTGPRETADPAHRVLTQS